MSSQASLLEHKFLHAGAGAGKTTRLISEIYDKTNSYYSLHKKFPNIIICTFTVKATQELKERLSEKAIAEENYLFLDYINDKSKIFISTIHGVLSYFLRSNAMSLGLDPNFKIVEDSEHKRLAKKISYKIIKDNNTYLSLLNYYSIKDLSDFFTLYYSSYLKGQVKKPHTKEELVRLWAEEEQGLLKELQRLTPEIENIIQILEQKKSKVLPQWQELQVGFKNILKANSIQQCRELFLTLKMPALRQAEIKEVGASIKDLFKDLEAFLTEDQYDLNFWLDKSEVNEKLSNFLGAVCSEFHKEVISKSFVSLSYIEELCAYFLAQDANLSADFNFRWDYWLIDEFQDTSRLQINILSRLIGPKPFFTVGDAQQSIYLFRGSDINVFNEVRQDFATHKRAIESLETNYRSQPNLLLFINDLFRSHNFLEMKPHKDFEENYEAAKIFLEINKDEQYAKIAAEVSSLIASGVSPEKIGILSRTNKDLRVLQKVLTASSIKSILSASGSFFQKQAVRDLLYFINFLQQPRNNLILLKLLRSPYFKISDEVLYQCITSAKEEKISLWDYLLTQRIVEKLVVYQDLLKDSSWLEVVMQFIEQEEVLSYANYFDDSGISLTSILRLIDWLFAKEKESGFLVYDIIDQILKGEDFALSDPEHLVPTGQVQLMTVHKSKGLQFDHVFIINIDKPFRSQADKNYYLELDENYFSVAWPYGKEQVKKHPFFAKQAIQDYKKDELSEHLRLFYVAVTRAVKKIYLCGEKTKNITASSWLSFIPANLLQVGRQSNYHISDVGLGRSNIDVQQTKIASHQMPLQLNTKSKLRFSVSDMLAKDFSAESGMSKGSSLQKFQAIAEGNKMHRELELIKYQAAKSDNFSIFKNDAIPLQKIIKSGFVEWGFAYKIETAIFEGKVDLWGIVDNNLWIIDYKTGSKYFMESAFFQLNAYSLVIREYTQNINAKLAVVYPKSGEVEVRDATNIKDIDQQLKSFIAGCV